MTTESTPWLDPDWEDIEKRLGLPAGVLSELRNGKDDWTFVLRLHAIADVALLHLVDVHVRKDGFRAYVESLTHGAKIRLARALRLLDPWEEQALNALSDVRAAYAHKITAMGQTLADRFAAMTQKQRTQTLSLLAGAVHLGEKPTPQLRREVREFVELSPRHALWLTTMNVVRKAYRMQPVVIHAGTGRLELRGSATLKLEGLTRAEVTHRDPTDG